MFLLCRCGGLRGGKDELRGFHPHSRVMHWDRLWSSIVKGEGIWSVGLDLFTRPVAVCHNQDLQDWDDAMHRFHPHPSPLPSRERGIWSVGLACSPASHPTLWILP